MKFKLSEEAEKEIDNIYEFIVYEKDNYLGAKKVIEEIYSCCEKISSTPGMGLLVRNKIEGLSEEYNELKMFPVNKYLIFYEIIEETIIVQRIKNAKQDYTRLFK